MSTHLVSLQGIERKETVVGEPVLFYRVTVIAAGDFVSGSVLL